MMLPIDPLLSELCAELASRGVVVLQAAPGAGKTTRVPPALLRAGLAGDGEIVVLEPRRLAARMAAKRVADELGERVGDTVGHQVRFDRRTGPSTRIRFVTEGVLTRELMRRPALDGVNVVVLDELHERHLHGDLALALIDRLRRRRPELYLLAMSATLDAAGVAERLGAALMQCDTPRFEVAIEHRAVDEREPIEITVAKAARQLLREGLDGLGGDGPGHLLVFLPGAGEIRRSAEACRALARDHDVDVLPLYGELPAREQDRAVAPSARRKLILATNVAESSITIEGVAAVIDSGWVRVARREPGSDRKRLDTLRISRASATQRAGRAGRTGPGRCVRLWSESEQRRLADFEQPEIERSDLSEAVLTLALAGVTDPEALRWLSPPPPEAIDDARRLLRLLGALDEQGRATPLARRMARLPLPPRLSKLLLEADERGAGASAALAAAILAERGDLRRRGRDGRARDTTLWHQLELYQRARQADFDRSVLDANELDVGAVHASRRALGQLTRFAGDDGPDPEAALSAALLHAFADRVAKRTGGAARDAAIPLALAGGGNAVVHDPRCLGGDGFCLALDLAGRRGEPALVRLAVPINADLLVDQLIERVEERRELVFDDTRQRVERIEQLRYLGLVLDESRRVAEPSDEASALLLQAAERIGMARLDPAFDGWLARMRFVATQRPDAPSASDDELAAALHGACAGLVSIDELRAVGLAASLERGLPPAARRRLRELAPERLRLASGRELTIDYPAGAPPVVASYLQDFFGMSEGPRLGDCPLVIELWAPNRRAIQVTRDLAGFWSRHYPELVRQLSRRYPKHHWPTDPLRAPPVRFKRDLPGPK